MISHRKEWESEERRGWVSIHCNNVPVHVSHHEFLDPIFRIPLPEGPKDGDPPTAVFRTLMLACLDLERGVKRVLSIHTSDCCAEPQPRAS
jgi:hypothetical protein